MEMDNRHASQNFAVLAQYSSGSALKPDFGDLGHDGLEDDGMHL